jgi:hypothetical protein
MAVTTFYFTQWYNITKTHKDRTKDMVRPWAETPGLTERISDAFAEQI